MYVLNWAENVQPNMYQNSKKSHFNIPHNYLDIVFLWGVVRIRKRFRSIEPALLRQFPWLMK